MASAHIKSKILNEVQNKSSCFFREAPVDLSINNHIN